MPDYIDPSYRYTEEEIETMVKAIRKLSTYTPENGGSVSSTQVKEIVEIMRKEGNPDQLKCYKEFWDHHFNGRMPIDTFVELTRAYGGNNENSAKTFVEKADANNDGFITDDEFEHLLKLFSLHDPKLGEKLKSCAATFEHFAAEADTNKDGKVSVEECIAWIEKKLSTEAGK